MTLKKEKYIGVTLIKYVQYVYDKNYITLMEKIKEDVNK